MLYEIYSCSYTDGRKNISGVQIVSDTMLEGMLYIRSIVCVMASVDAKSRKRYMGKLELVDGLIRMKFHRMSGKAMLICYPPLCIYISCMHVSNLKSMPLLWNVCLEESVYADCIRYNNSFLKENLQKAKQNSLRLVAACLLWNCSVARTSCKTVFPPFWKKLTHLHT